MSFETFGQHRTSRWLLVGVATLGFWLLFGTGRPSTVVSTWGGDANLQADAQQPLGQPLTGLFSKEAQPAPPGSTGLANLLQDPEMPWGVPVDSSAAVMTQGYGVGTHAPAPSWGAVDIALDGNNDGAADPQGSDGAPVYATHRGVVEITPNSVPAGNHVWVRGTTYNTGFSHLKGFAVETGQVVERGTLIGYMGSTGLSSGPHLDYQIWKDGVNQNPLDYGALP